MVTIELQEIEANGLLELIDIAVRTKGMSSQGAYARSGLILSEKIANAIIESKNKSETLKEKDNGSSN